MSTQPRPVAPATAPTASSAKVTRVNHRVGFYQTDAMGIMHHANYAHLLENARVAFLAEHDEPYVRYVDAGLHFAVTKVEIEYLRPARFDDDVCTTVWIEWVRFASLGIAYELSVEGKVIARARTEHAMVNDKGNATRIPREKRMRLAAASRTDGSPAP